MALAKNSPIDCFLVHELTRGERRVFQHINTPAKIQDFLDAVPINFERGGDTFMSPRRVIRERKAHCLEGALFAAAALSFHGRSPLLMDLKTTGDDQYHVVALFRERSGWGAISKTNHAVLRYREPVYKTLRELAMSYFHEYFLDDGRKTLRSCSLPLNLSRFSRRGWVTDEKDLWYIDDALERARHIPIISPASARALRRADRIEREAGRLIQWRRGQRAK